MTGERDDVRRLIDIVPRRIRALRQEAMTRTELAKRTGIDVNLLRRIETTQLPSLEQLIRITRELDVAPWELLGPFRYGHPSGRVRRLRDQGGSTGWAMPTQAIPARPVQQHIHVGRQDASVRHSGTEWILVVSGTVEVALQTLGQPVEPVLLNAGDELDFDASIEHVVTNAGDVPAVLYRLFDESGIQAHAANTVPEERSADRARRELEASSKTPASLRITRIGSEDANLSWLSSFILPKRMEVEVVDLGHRADLVLTLHDSQVAASADFVNRRHTLQTNCDPEAPIARYATLILEAMQRAYDPEAAEEAITVETTQVTEGEWFTPHQTRWPNPAITASEPG